MANVRKLIENNLDDPESFDVNRHLQSPVARLAQTNGFVRDEQVTGEERWVKKLSNGSEAWLRSHLRHPDFEEPAFDPADPIRTGGREWELVLVKPNRKTGERDFNRLAQAKEMHMSYLLGAFLQRLATWPRGQRKPTLEARRPKVPLPDPDDPNAVLTQFVTDKTPYLPEYARLARLMSEHPEMYVEGRITRHDHHYVHENTTVFNLEVLDVPPEIEEEVGKLADVVENLIQEECVRINHKIYKALEREWDWLNSDESVDEMMAANLYTFDEEGDEGGTIPFDQLNDDAKETARDWYRSDGFDYQWWDHTYEEWTAELEEMGFAGVDISFSGFSSQGDGASFIATSFNFLTWANWHMSTKATEKGHPYTDDLKESIDDPPAKEHVIRMGRAGECQELCSICGAYCTLNHYALPSGIQMPQYHICQTCDTEAATAGMENFEESDDPEMARIRKRLAKTKAKREAEELAKNPEILALDDPSAILSQEVTRRSEPIKKLEIRGRRWWRRGIGGQYCTAYIYINDKLVHTTPIQGGGDSHYLTLATDWLRRHGYLEGLLDDERDPIWYLRDKQGIDLQYGAVDVRRERDL